jgi:hypothetical protein
MPMASVRRPVLRALLLIVFAACAVPAAAAEEKEKDSDFWWWIHGFEITPGVGLRTLSLDVHSKSNGTQGNLSNNFGAGWLFGSINIESPSFQFGKTDFGASVYAYASGVRLDHQFVADPGQDPNGDQNSGSRQNVGTKVTGYYSYLVPALHYRKVAKDGSGFKIALGYGRWSGRFSGDVILTPHNRPATGLPKTPVDTVSRTPTWSACGTSSRTTQLMMTLRRPKMAGRQFPLPVGIDHPRLHVRPVARHPELSSRAQRGISLRDRVRVWRLLGPPASE